MGGFHHCWGYSIWISGGLDFKELGHGDLHKVLNRYQVSDATRLEGTSRGECSDSYPFELSGGVKRWIDTIQS